MVRNVKILEGKQYTTRKIRKVIIDEDDSESMSCKNHVLKEKNRQSAQRSRDNKKKFVINLELRVAELETQNTQLKQRLEESDQRIKFLESKLGHGDVNQSLMEQEAVVNCEQASDETESGKDSFQRLSARSFISCSNFLMLAIIAVCCICSFIEPIDKGSEARGFYTTDNLDRIMGRIKESNLQSSEVDEIQGIIRGFSPRNIGFPTHRKNYTQIKDLSNGNSNDNPTKTDRQE